MNTPAHLILNAAVLGRGRWRDRVAPISFGAVLPDLPMFAFYLYQRMIAGAPERQIWSGVYFDADWQAFFDAYDEVRPISAAYRSHRRYLYQLFYLLVHVNLFGASYVAGAHRAATQVVAALT